MKKLFLLLLSLSSPAFAAKILILPLSDVTQTREWQKEQCQLIHEAAQTNGQVDSQCVDLNLNKLGSGFSVERAIRSHNFKYIIFFHQTDEDSYKLTVKNGDRMDDSEFDAVGWTIKTGKKEVLKDKINLLLGQVMDFEFNKKTVKAVFLAGGLSESTTMKAVDGKIVDVRTQKELTDDEAYNQFIKEGQKQKHYVRAAVELALTLGVASFNYWLPEITGKGTNSNLVDWDYYGSEGQRRRLRGLSGLRMDDNSRTVNVGHAYAGMVYYQLARSNNLSTMESFLAGFAASALWEVVNEYREVISLNDMILTPVGGFVIGETLHQFGRYLKSRGMVGKALSVLFDAPGALNSLLDSRGERKFLESDFDSAASGFINFFAAKAQIEENGQKTSGTMYGMQGEINNIRYYNEKGQANQWYTDTILTDLYVRMTGREDALSDFQAFAKVVFTGYHQKNIGLDAEQKKKGYSMFIGATSAVSVNQRAEFEGQTGKDWNAVIHVLGSTMDVSWFVKDVKIRMTIDVLGDFAMVRSYALDNYVAANPDLTGTESTIRRHQYYYGSGITAITSFQLDYKKLSAGAKFSRSDWSSIHGQARNQESVTNDLNFKDTVSKQEFWVGAKLGHGFSIKLSYERERHEGTIDGAFGELMTVKRKMGYLEYRF
jgi:hypothetical protein